ncbi:MAG: EcsC family protein [Bacteriovoracaceae bacterium]|nr:EcsC family protein [Bacteriovoracaceae bacterium]
MIISGNDLDNLERAMCLLEYPGILIKLTDLIGGPIEKGIEYLPKNWKDKIGEISNKSLTAGVNFAVKSVDSKSDSIASEILHKAAVAIAGAGGGAFGLPALAIEMPVSTVIMLRSIVEIARSEGENIDSVETKISCLEVFAFGGPSTSDDASESSYFAIRTVLAKTVSEAAAYIAKGGAVEVSAPVLIRLVSKIAERFGVVISEKAAAQAIPILGAIGGAIVNTLFIDHFQDMARGHFIVRRLERKYGTELVKETYESLKLNHNIK